MDQTTRERIESIDFVRGAVMVLMLLDHARDFIHTAGVEGDPLDPRTTTAALFATRWVTHLCAPTFVFLAGVSARLQQGRGMTRAALSRYLLSRGAFLIVLELVVLRLLIFPLEPLSGLLSFLQVIWALGWSMIVLAGLVHAPLVVTATFGATQVLLHNLLDPIRVAAPARGAVEAVWMVLHQSGAIELGSDGPWVLAKYPLVPWIGVMALGYVAGGLYARESSARRRLLGRASAALAAAFLVLRGTNLYGDPRPWETFRSETGAVDFARSLFSFLNVEKYPPSLAYLAATLGITLAALAWLDGRTFRGAAGPVVTLGRVPLFFYVLQWPLLGLVGWGLRAADGQTLEPGSGFSLAVVYVVWAGGLVVLYPLCVAFAKLRARSRAPWLRYL